MSDPTNKTKYVDTDLNLDFGFTPAKKGLFDSLNVSNTNGLAGQSAYGAPLDTSLVPNMTNTFGQVDLNQYTAGALPSLTDDGFDFNAFLNSKAPENIAQLGGLVMSGLGYLENRKNNAVARKATEQNIAFMKQDQDSKNKMRAGLAGYQYSPNRNVG